MTRLRPSEAFGLLTHFGFGEPFYSSPSTSIALYPLSLITISMRTSFIWKERSSGTGRRCRSSIIRATGPD
jgi:hypothetical protein